MAESVQLITGGMSYEGWESIEITRSLDTMCGSFEAKVTERWPGRQATFAIKPGDACQLTIGGKTVIAGYVDDREPGYDESHHFVTLRGRDAAGDLVDCSTVVSAVKLPTAPAIKLIQQICAPFGIRVTADVPQAQQTVVDPAIQVSETAFEAISRIAEQCGFLVISDGQGGLKITDAGTAGSRSAAILGENILRARGVNSMKGRFSKYTVGCQVIADDNADPTTSVAGQGTATDPGVPRYRPLIIIADIMSNGLNWLQQRAQWEATVRLGRAWRASITVAGWRDAAHALWAPNTLVRVRDEFLAIDDELLISGVRFSLDEEGELTELTVTRKQAYKPTPVPDLPSMTNIGGGP